MRHLKQIEPIKTAYDEGLIDRKKGGDCLDKRPKGEVMKKRLIAIGLLVGIMYLVADMLNLLLLTFVFSFLLYSLTTWILKKTNRWFKISEKLVVLLMYGFIILTLSMLGYLYAPIAMKQVVGILEGVMSFRWEDYQNSIHPKIYDIVSGYDLEPYLKEASAYVMAKSQEVGTFLISLFLAFLLSFFLLWEKKEIVSFLKGFETGRTASVYHYLAYFGKNFVNTFGTMIQMQFIIALVNAVLSVIFLYFLGFSQIWGLGVLIFALGLIPVVGVVISLIPLSIIAFQIGGVMKIVHVLIMIAVLHAFEAYMLNPKLVSTKMKLPLFISFSVLIIAEHILGVWGLLVGIPLFMFLLDLLREPIETPKDSEDTP